jgi:hypothetical protein
LSDYFGRKPLAILGFVAATNSVRVFAQTGASVWPLVIALCVSQFLRETAPGKAVAQGA